MSEKDLKIKASITGAEDTAAKIDQISGAEEKLGKTTEAKTSATTAATEAQDKLNASESDFTGLLTAISPQLGATVDGMLKAAKVAGELDLAQGGLAKTLGRVTAAAAKHATTLKLIGAGGAVVVAISLIAKSIESMRKEFEAATKAIKDNEDALNELREKEADRKREIEQISDSRRGGGFSADEARAARISGDRIKAKLGDLSDAAINQAQGLLGDQGMSQKELANAAFLIQSGRLNLDANAPTATNRRIFEASSRRNADASATFFNREGVQQGEANQEARQQASATTGATDQLRRIIEETLGPGADIEAIAKRVKQFVNVRGLEEGIANSPFPPVNGDTGAVVSDRLGKRTGETVYMSELELANTRRVLQRIDNPSEQRTVNITNNYNQQNARFIGSSASAQRRRITNGETIARDVER